MEAWEPTGPQLLSGERRALKKGVYLTLLAQEGLTYSTEPSGDWRPGVIGRGCRLLASGDRRKGKD